MLAHYFYIGSKERDRGKEGDKPWNIQMEDGNYRVR